MNAEEVRDRELGLDPVERHWQEQCHQAGRIAVMADDALELVCKKHGLRLPVEREKVGLEQSVDILVGCITADAWEGNFVLVQAKSSSKGGGDDLKEAKKYPDWLPLLIGHLKPGDDVTSALDIATNKGHYPAGWTEMGEEGRELQRLAEEVRSKPRRTELPLWAEVYLGIGGKAKETKLRDRIQGEVGNGP
jgi:hypothetical protein